MDTDEKIRQRIQRLEDIEAARDTFYEYLCNLDIMDADSGIAEFADLFAEDASVEMIGLESGDGVFRGRKSIVEDFYRGFPDKEEDSNWSGHHGTNPRVVIDGDSATVNAYFFEIVLDNLLVIGNYDCRMQRENDRWRIAYLRITANSYRQLKVMTPRTSFIAHPGSRPLMGLDESVKR